MLGHSVGEIALLGAWIACAGVLVGILAGLFGIGGGAIIVPVLYEVFRALGVPEELRMQLCIGTSLAIIVPTTVRSYLGHKKKGAVIPDVLRLWAVPSVAGVAIGAAAAAYAPAPVFKLAFVIFAGFIAVRMLFGTDRWSLGAQLPGRGPMALFGFLTGLFASLVGVSGGSFCTAILTFYGQPMQRAVATAAGVGVPITIAGAVGYVLAGWKHADQLPPLSIGFVSLIGLVLMAPVSAYAASYGVRLAHWLPRRQLEIAFGIFLGVASLRFLISLL
ncbi:MAG TPA: sulfite exporter TauE/SafE family protein [Pseudolabrys sp.]|nr:sulfite exporter TauE/SafE family protein [Pseudolabrys sp.]